jgi:hypothetical protein
VADSVRCKGCGRFRPAQLAHAAERLGCPHCGATAVTIGVSLNLTIQPTMRIRSSLRPGDQRQDWERRWQDIQDDGRELLIPLTGTMSSSAIQIARRWIQSFYVNAYHLKDDLRVASPAIGVTAATIEAAVTNDPDLALLCDLANLVKHRRLTRPCQRCSANWTARRGSWRRCYRHP